MRRIAIFAAALAIVVALPALAPAKAGKKYKTTVTLDGIDFVATPGRAAARALGSYFFYGSVESPNAKCRKGRRVIVLFDPNEGDKRRLGWDLSDSEGNWSLRLDVSKYPPEIGNLQAKAPKRKLPKGKLCKPDVSPLMSLPH